MVGLHVVPVYVYALNKDRSLYVLHEVQLLVVAQHLCRFTSESRLRHQIISSHADGHQIA